MVQLTFVLVFDLRDSMLFCIGLCFLLVPGSDGLNNDIWMRLGRNDKCQRSMTSGQLCDLFFCEEAPVRNTTHATLAAPKIPNLKAPSFLLTFGGLKACQTRLGSAPMLCGLT